MRRNVQRADLLGMGCAGAMPGLQRAFDFVKAYPDKKALLLTVEICSACYYVDDSLETVVGNAICADGAAAVVVGMSEDPSVPKISGFATYLEPSLIDAVGFKGADCEQATRFLEEALGVVGAKQKEPEYHQRSTTARAALPTLPDRP